MKKKLSLQIDELRVEQFETHPDSPVGRGTVHGFQSEGGIGVSEPCRYCIDMPETWSCNLSECC